MALAEILTALPWLAPYASLFRIARAAPNLSDIPPVDGTPVTVIIPDRKSTRLNSSHIL